VVKCLCVALFLLPVCVPSVAHSQASFRPEEIKLIIPVPKPEGPEIRIRHLTVPAPPVKPSPTATELLNPVLKMFRNLAFTINATGEALNAHQFKSARSLLEAPETVQIASTFRIRPKLQNLSALDLMVAKRAMKALSEYEPSEGENTGRVCVNASGLFKKITAFAGVRVGGTEPPEAVLEMPASELVKVSIEARAQTRYAAVTLEFDKNLSFAVKRYTLSLPLRIKWDYGKLAVLAAGSQLSADENSACVLNLSLGPLEPNFAMMASLKIPRTKRVKKLTHVQVRVAPAGQRVLGTPVLVGVER
jgi:hypothetical protein